MTNQNQSVIDNDHQRVWNGSFTGMWNAARPARASNRGCFFVAVLCGPELESKKCVESAVPDAQSALGNHGLTRFLVRREILRICRHASGPVNGGRSGRANGAANIIKER